MAWLHRRVRVWLVDSKKGRDGAARPVGSRRRVSGSGTEPVVLEMRCSWGELKTVDVTPLALGWRNECIADELGVTLNTVQAHGAGNR